MVSKNYEEIVELYIDTPLSLADEIDETIGTKEHIARNMFTILKRLHMLYRETGLVPILMSDNFLLETKADNFSQELKEKIDSKTEKLEVGGYLAKYTDFIKDVYKHSSQKLVINSKDKEHFKRFFDSLEVMMEMVGYDFREYAESYFIDLYIKWQKEEVTVDDIEQNNIKPISRNSWYRYGGRFEENYIYPEYMSAFEDVIFKTPKKKDIKDYSTFMTDYTEGQAESLKQSGKSISQYVYEKNEEVRAVSDVRRIYRAYKQKQNK